MRLAKSIIPKKIKTLHCLFLTVLVLFTSFFLPVFGQDNSPYSRYGIGDLVPHSSITSRGMGGLTAAYADISSINFNNPATYSKFVTYPQLKSKKLAGGVPILDVGMNFESRSLKQSNPDMKFTASNALFSYVYVGIPIRKNWGLSFGIRPVSRISYKIFKEERLYDPNTGLPIDSSLTRFEGDGGSYVASVGSGISIFSKNRGKPIDENLSIGLNAGYFFGKKDYRSKRSLINDTVQYLQANYQDRTSFGGIQLNAGIHYRLPVGKRRLFSAGGYGTWTPTMNASQDRIRETFYFDPSFGDVRLDSVSDIKNVQGKILIPGTFTIGFAFQQYATTLKEGGWLIGLDFMVQNWEKYRFYGGMDSVRNKWEVRLGAQLNPVYRAKSYFTRVAYRAGIFAGPDYINVRQKLPLFGASFGMALPITGENRFNRGQASILNLSLEYIRRGNTDNLVHENMFRVSLGFSLSDIWFTKRRYD